MNNALTRCPICQNELTITRLHCESCDTSLEGWSRALELRDRDTEGHSQRVTQMTLLLARAMDVSAEQLVHIRRPVSLLTIFSSGTVSGKAMRKGRSGGWKASADR